MIIDVQVFERESGCGSRLAASIFLFMIIALFTAAYLTLDQFGRRAEVLSFEATVSALADAILRARCPETYGGEPGASAPVARFLLATHASMPDYLWLPFKILTLIFGLWSLPLAGATFQRLSLEARARQIRTWQESALGVRRDLVKFYETLVIFGWYVELYGQDYRHNGG